MALVLAAGATAFLHRATVAPLRLELDQTRSILERQEKLASLGVDPMIMTPSDMDALVRKEIDLNAELVKNAGIKGH